MEVLPARLESITELIQTPFRLPSLTPFAFYGNFMYIEKMFFMLSDNPYFVLLLVNFVPPRGEDGRCQEGRHGTAGRGDFLAQAEASRIGEQEVRERDVFEKLRGNGAVPTCCEHGRRRATPEGSPESVATDRDEQNGSTRGGWEYSDWRSQSYNGNPAQNDRMFRIFFKKFGGTAGRFPCQPVPLWSRYLRLVGYAASRFPLICSRGGTPL